MIKNVKSVLLYIVLICILVGQSTQVSAQSGSIYKTLQTPFYDPGGTVDVCNNLVSVKNELPGSIPPEYSALFTQAAAAYKTNVQLLAAIFLTENGNIWKPFNSTWATSPAGASGPFQFMPATWDAYRVDGDNDGKKDINNIYDAAFSAANLIYAYNARANSPLGSLSKPFKTNTLLQISASYNWGPGSVQENTNSDSPITVAPIETQNYLKNVYSLITSGFTKSGHPNYPDPAVSTGPPAGEVNLPTGCSGGVVAGSIVQTALNLAWPGPREPKNEPKPEYKNAPPTSTSAGNCFGADCGVFVSTVMLRSGADPNYPISGTSVQAAYLKNNPQKYDVVQLGPGDSTAGLLPGDILIVNAGGGEGASGHTYIFVGQQPGGYNQASASWSSDCANSRMPSLGTAVIVDERGYYMRARLK